MYIACDLFKLEACRALVPAEHTLLSSSLAGACQASARCWPSAFVSQHECKRCWHAERLGRDRQGCQTGRTPQLCMTMQGGDEQKEVKAQQLPQSGQNRTGPTRACCFMACPHLVCEAHPAPERKYAGFAMQLRCFSAGQWSLQMQASALFQTKWLNAVTGQWCMHGAV